MTTIYHCHPATGEYLGEGQADPSPLEPGVYLIPAHATELVPPDPIDGMRRVFDGEGWTLVTIEPEPVPEPEAPTPEPEPEPEPEVTHDDLRAELSQVHNTYCSGTTQHRGIAIAIDVEARVNAQGTLDAVKAGKKALPFQWYAGSESIEVASVADMQAIHDAIFAALERGYTAKGIVLAKVPAITDPSSYDVSTAYQVALR